MKMPPKSEPRLLRPAYGAFQAVAAALLLLICLASSMLAQTRTAVVDLANRSDRADPGGVFELLLDGGDLVVRNATGPEFNGSEDGTRSRELFRAAASSLDSLSIRGTAGDDRLRIIETASGLPRFYSQAGEAHSNGAFEAVTGRGVEAVGLSFNGGSGFDWVEMHFSTRQDVAYYSDEVALTKSGLISVDGSSGLLVLSFQGLEPIGLAGAGGSLTVDASSTAATTTLTVADLAPAGDGVNEITGDGGFETVTFSGFAALTLRGGDGSETITLASLDAADPDGGGPGAALTTVTLDGDNTAGTDSADDLFLVEQTPAAASVTVNGGGGNDIINVGSPGSTLAPILGPVTVNGEDHNAAPLTTVLIKGDSLSLPSGDVLIVDDAGSGVASTSTLTATTYLQSGALVTYDTVETLFINVGSGNSDVDVMATAASMVTDIADFGGVDDVDVTTTGDGSILIVNAGTGADDVNVASTGAGAFVIADGESDADVLAVQSTGAGGRVGLFGGIGMDVLSALGVGPGGLANLDGGDDSDSFFVTPSTAGEVCVEGGLPIAAPGDVLNYSTAGLVDLSFTGSIPGSGVISSSSHQNVTYSGIEALVPEPIDLQITKTGTDTVTAGSGPANVVHVVTVTNNGPVAATAASVSEAITLPAGVTIDSIVPSTGTYSPANSANGTWTIPGLAVSASATLTVTLTAGDTTAAGVGVISNTATALAAGPGQVLVNLSDDAATHPTSVGVEADLSITKTDGVTSAVPGQDTLTYTIVASNNGPSADPIANLTDTFPAELTCTYTSVTAGGATGNTAAGSGNLAETLDLPAGGSVTYTATCSIDAGAIGTLSNTAVIAASVTDPTPGNNSATDADTVLQPETDLSITKTDGGAVAAAPGGTLSYGLAVLNNGPSDSTGGSATDVLPAGVTFSSSTSGCSDAAGTVTCPVPALANGANVMLTFDVMVSAAQTVPIVNTASVSGNEADSNGANNSSSVTTSLIPLFSKAFSPSTIMAGGTSTVTFTIDNFGAVVNATALAFVDNLPASVVVASSSNVVDLCGGAVTAASGSSVITFSGGSAAAGASCTIDVDVTSDMSGSHINTTGDLTSSLGNSGTATATLMVGPATTAVTVSDASTPYSDVDRNVTLAALVTDSIPVDEGSVTFTVLDGAVPVGAAVTSATVVAGMASVSYVLPGLMPVNVYTIQADYSGGSDFSASSGSGALTVAPLLMSDDDGDGVDNMTEDAAPNAGDGDGDGILDSLQSTVTSLPSATSGQYLTMVATGPGCVSQFVMAIDPGSLPADSNVIAGFAHPQGLLSFELDCPAANVAVLYHGETDLGQASYRKYGSLPSDPILQWYELPATFSTTTVGGSTVAAANFDLTDGGLGDHGGAGDGRIVDPGGPGVVIAGIPTLSQWLLLTMAALMVGAGLLVLRTAGF